MKVKINFFSLLGLILLLSCKHSASILSKEKYTDIILDLQVAETLISDSQIKNKDSLRGEIQLRICSIYGFKDLKSLKASLEPLQYDPELMLDITKIMAKKLDQLADSAISYPLKDPRKNLILK